MGYAMNDMVEAMNTIRRYDPAARRDYVAWWEGAIRIIDAVEWAAHPTLYPEDECYE